MAITKEDLLIYKDEKIAEIDAIEEKYARIVASETDVINAQIRMLDELIEKSEIEREEL